jgi:hypothetical protein
MAGTAAIAGVEAAATYKAAEDAAMTPARVCESRLTAVLQTVQGTRYATRVTV